MAKTRARSSGFDATLLLQIALVLFLITLGIVGLAEYNSRLNELGRSLSRLFGRPDNPVNLIVAIAELVAGILIGVALFAPIGRRVIWVACIIIGVLWIINILWVFFFNNAFEPDFAIWLNGLSADLIVLAVLWLVAQRYA
jgi:hypothetical protein